MEDLGGIVVGPRPTEYASQIRKNVFDTSKVTA
jgi:hypothetical protein